MAYRQVREEIVEGIMAPGAAIDQEALAARLGLSTTPVREALRRLESEGLVVSRPHRDTIVAPLSLQQLEDTYAVRLALDPLAVEIAAQDASDDDLGALRELAEKAAAAADSDPVTQMYQNRNLHRAMYRACGNAVLIQTLDTLWDSSDRYRLTLLRGDRTIGSQAHAEHSAIVRAMVERRAGDAAALMREHVAGSLERVKKAPAVQS